MYSSVGMGHNESVFAAVDIGSHTIRLLIAACKEKTTLQPLCLRRRVTRLARGFSDRSALGQESMRTSLEALEEYAALLQQHGVSATACGATGVVRRAGNGADFLSEIARKTGIAGIILSEEREALLSVKGILAGLARRPGLMLAFDLGGSSTEFILVDPTQPRPVWATSVFLGAATLTEACLNRDPPGREALERASTVARCALQPIVERVAEHVQRAGGSAGQLDVVGTAGTVTTLAAMHLQMEDYQPYRINGMLLSSAWVSDTIETLASLPIARRQDIRGLEKGREDIILGGAVLVRELLRGLRRDSLTVTDAGLLEGLLLESIEDHYSWPHTLKTPLTWLWQ
jgi:exopolyphosphatase / guanosine-5'-triphosphate,3'-diphosphate pyrophosphatase